MRPAQHHLREAPTALGERNPHRGLRLAGPNLNPSDLHANFGLFLGSARPVTACGLLALYVRKRSHKPLALFRAALFYRGARHNRDNRIKNAFSRKLGEHLRQNGSRQCRGRLGFRPREGTRSKNTCGVCRRRKILGGELLRTELRP
jgi:hypothetical protein